MQIIAHRGAPLQHGWENTIHAFNQAIENGADGFECDVVLTQDRVPVILHPVSYNDDHLPGFMNASGKVSQMGWRQIAAIRLPGGSSIPTLDSVLDLVACTKATCYLEPKVESRWLVEEIMKCVSPDIRNRCSLITFAKRSVLLKWAKQANSQVRRNAITINPFCDLALCAPNAHANEITIGWKSGFNHQRFCCWGSVLATKVSMAGVPVSAGLVGLESDFRWVRRGGIGQIFTDDVMLAAKWRLGAGV